MSDALLSAESGEVQCCAELSDGLAGVEQGDLQPSVELSDTHKDIAMCEVSDKQIASDDKFAEDHASSFMAIDIDNSNVKDAEQLSTKTSPNKSKPTPIDTSFKPSNIIFTLNVCE